MTDEELKLEISKHPYWYHAITLRPGIQTPGWAPLDASKYRIPEDMTNKRVLDVGAWDGYWTFEALKRGASYVAAIDDFSDTLGSITNVDRTPAWQTFDFCRDALGFQDRCERHECSVYEVDDIVTYLKQFDHVFCFGLLYHLKHPLLALEILRKVCTGTIHIETAILDGCQSAYGDYGYDGDECVFEFYPNDEYGRNKSNWYVGTLKAWSAMVEAAGFKNVESWKLTDNPRCVSEARGFIRAEV